VGGTLLFWVRPALFPVGPLLGGVSSRRVAESAEGETIVGAG